MFTKLLRELHDHILTGQCPEIGNQTYFFLCSLLGWKKTGLGAVQLASFRCHWLESRHMLFSNQSLERRMKPSWLAWVEQSSSFGTRMDWGTWRERKTWWLTGNQHMTYQVKKGTVSGKVSEAEAELICHRDALRRRGVEKAGWHKGAC